MTAGSSHNEAESVSHLFAASMEDLDVILASQDDLDLVVQEDDTEAFEFITLPDNDEVDGAAAAVVPIPPDPSQQATTGTTGALMFAPWSSMPTWISVTYRDVCE